MLSGLFTSQIEKDIKALAENTPELQISYEGGQSASVSLLLKVYRKTVVLLGFYEKLKDKNLVVTLLSNGAYFKTKVLRRGVDSNGSTLFHCVLPEKILPPPRPLKRFKIKGQGVAKILISTNRGEKMMKLPIWEVCETGLTLANPSDVQFKIGTKLFQAMISLGGGATHLVDLQIANLRRARSDPKQLLVCAFSKEPRGLGDLLSVAKGLVPKVKPSHR